MLCALQFLLIDFIKEAMIESEIPAAHACAAPLLINQVMTQVIDFGARAFGELSRAVEIAFSPQRALIHPDKTVLLKLHFKGSAYSL